jgi:hypothetical protein
VGTRGLEVSWAAAKRDRPVKAYALTGLDSERISKPAKEPLLVLPPRAGLPAGSQASRENAGRMSTEDRRRPSITDGRRCARLSHPLQRSHGRVAPEASRVRSGNDLCALVQQQGDRLSEALLKPAWPREIKRG